MEDGGAVNPLSQTYRRFHIEAKTAPDLDAYPSRFVVKVKRHKLAALLLKEFIHYRGNLPVVASRPCVYGVFSGPIGGFAPRPHLCVGCLRCTVQYPDMVEIRRNPKRERLGDSYFTLAMVDAVHYEAQTGRVPVRGAGYRGKFGGDGWDGMWTDMSEIVRPTRDGIHGREFISTAVDIGSKPDFLRFTPMGDVEGEVPKMITLPVPFLLDLLPTASHQPKVVAAVADAANRAETMACLPAEALRDASLPLDAVVPVIHREEDLSALPPALGPRMVELSRWDEALHAKTAACFPSSHIAVRISLDGEFRESVVRLAKRGVSVLHLEANYHGRNRDGQFVGDLIAAAHGVLLSENLRDRVTLIASGGIVAADHVSKAIICGADVVALDTALLMALQGQMARECAERETSRIHLPEFPSEWGAQRITNLLVSWRDQLLEVLGAMGMREVRRLRGERGRAMFQQDLEREAFGEIDGYGR